MPKLTCKHCGNPVHRTSKNRVCRSCYDGKTTPPPDTFVAKGEEAELSKVVSCRIKTLAQLVETCEIDTTTWRIVEWVCNVWEGFAKFGKPGAERIVQPQMFQVKARLKLKTEIIGAREEIASLVADAKKQIAVIKDGGYVVDRELPTKPHSKYMLELHIPDLHIGKLAWSKETGHENYDSKIAVRLFHEAVETLIARTATYTFNHIVFVVGNDVLNADTKANTTTSGTPQDTDSRYQKSFLAARRMLVDTITRLATLAPVTVPVVPGNHDALGAWHLGDSLECWFHGDPRVTVQNDPTLRKYHQFGKVMLMFTHGNKGKLINYPQVMAAEQPEMFGATLYREAHTGDKHHTRVQEHYGVRVRISPALCAPDAWHAENQYIGSQRGAEAFVWSADEGLVGTAVYTVPKV